MFATFLNSAPVSAVVVDTQDDAPEIEFAEYVPEAPTVIDPVSVASFTVSRRELLDRLRIVSKGSAVRLSINGSVELSALWGSRHSFGAPGIDAQGKPVGTPEHSWGSPDYSLTLADSWERSGDVAAVIDDAAQLAKILTKTKADAVRVQVSRNADTADCVVSVATDKAEFELSATDAQNFPVAKPLETDSVVMLSAAELLHGLEQTVYACDAESTRYAMGGVLVELRADGITFAATDSRRLAKIDLAGEQCAGFKAGSAVLPAAALELAVSQLKKSAGNVALAIRPEGDAENPPGFQIDAEGWTISGRIVDGRFPDYRKIIPSEFAHYVKADRAELLEALETVQLAGSAESRGCDFTFDAAGALTLKMQGAGKGSVRVASAESAVVGKSVDCVTFDPGFIVEYLKHADAAECVLAMTGHESAAMMECEGSASYIVMPLSRDR